jgi:hypothetical protein
VYVEYSVVPWHDTNQIIDAEMEVHKDLQVPQIIRGKLSMRSWIYLDCTIPILYNTFSSARACLNLPVRYMAMEPPFFCHCSVRLSVMLLLVQGYTIIRVKLDMAQVGKN